MPEGCHHLFLFSEGDHVCSPDDIRAYISALAFASEASGSRVGSCKSVKVKGTHCDGLFWSAESYSAAVRELLARGGK